jgi:hypothetical protein
MQINYREVSVQITPQEFNDLVNGNLVDQMISAVMLLGMSPEDLMDEDLDLDERLLEEMIEGVEDIDDKERIRGLFKSFKRFTTDDDEF